jgi:hypothetical protein
MIRKIGRAILAAGLGGLMAIMSVAVPSPTANAATSDECSTENLPNLSPLEKVTCMDWGSLANQAIILGAMHILEPAFTFIQQTPDASNCVGVSRGAAYIATNHRGRTPAGVVIGATMSVMILGSGGYVSDLAELDVLISDGMITADDKNILLWTYSIAQSDTTATAMLCFASDGQLLNG